MSDDNPNPPPSGAPGGGRPPGSSSRRRRRGRGSRGAGAASQGGAQPGGAPQQGRPPSQARPAGGGGGGGSRSSRGSDRRGGGGGERGGRRGQPQPQQPPAVRELEITDDKIFQRLLDSGLDLAEEAVIEAFLYFTGESAARRVAAQLEGGGYQTFVDPSPPGRWLLEAVTKAVPSPDNIAAMGATLRNAARSNSGSYDGWWASEPPEEEAGLVGVALEEDPQPGQEDDLEVQPE